ncbi:MAG: butyrate kinase [Clostridiales bacterium]|nr:butyrate kinase [Clostridiales bacterium]
MSYKILIINPGSTSTKISVYENEKEILSETLRHPAEEIAKFATIPDQKDFRKQIILDSLKKEHFDMSTLNAVSCRGGLLKPIHGGTYATTPELLADSRKGVQGQHAANLGALIGKEIGDELGIPSFVVDPPTVDEMMSIAKYSGLPIIERQSKFHALNQKAVARRYAKEVGKKYDELNLIVCHMGGGISVGAHCHGEVIDTYNALDGEGPFTPERTGSLPCNQLVDLCFGGKYTEGEIRKMITGRGGLVAYTGSTDMRDLIDAMNKGDKKVTEVVDAFHYQIAKEIAALSACLKGKIDQIILTGGIAYGKETVDALTEYIGWIAPVTTYPGEDEMLSLAQGALRVLNGEEKLQTY